MKIFATVAPDGFPNGFYNDVFHTADQIPVDAVEITRPQWEELNQFQGARKLVDGEVIVYEPPPPPEPPLPPLSARQFRLGLHANGLLASVQSSIDALEEPAKTAAQIEWEYATQIERTHPLVSNLSVQLGLTDEQIDAMWRNAVGL